MKTQLALYIEGETKQRAKDKGINLSQAFEQFLNIETDILENKKENTEKEIIRLLKKELAMARTEIKRLENKLKVEDGWKEIPIPLK